jgi:hypothetical protein
MTDNDPIEMFRGEPMLYTLKELEAKAISFLQESKRYKNMSARDKKELARMKALAASRLANNLKSAETPDFVAWPKAIREAILEEDSA